MFSTHEMKYIFVFNRKSKFIFYFMLLLRFIVNQLINHTSSRITIIYKTRNCVYETLCPQPLVCPPSFSPGNLFIILFQLTKSEATSCHNTSCNSFKISLLGVFDVQICKGYLLKNMQSAKKKHFRIIFTRYLIITLYQLSKFEDPSCNVF